ncbi:MAG: hypothetical protein MR591_02755 [Helicobacter sp.]|uniref:Response regulatory domain-containing protein n=1 Tax=Helicobacter equorum TaxID=361872 RepID=A0A3D8IN09_9HELI|nr:hypothetical protein [Helicobacter equorum]MCI6312693.1 hypothetical protein [Helicobacter sp.]RDU66315.1 hypothetical protein CQA54_07530 [Helicobacter equorum]
MLQGILLEIDTENKQGKIEQAVNRRQYLFNLDLWEGKANELCKNAEIEFDVEKARVIKIRPKPKPIDPNEIPVTKSAQECITEFFERENIILQNYKDFMENHPRLDFLRSQRFILTAYNDLCEMDGTLANPALKKLRQEILALYKEFENYVKKTEYSLEYSFEKIFLNRQSAYLKAQNLIEATKSSLNNAQAQVRPLSKELEESEFALKNSSNKHSKDFQELEKDVKAMRKRYVDLVNFIAVQKDLLVKTTDRLKNFRQQHLQEFSEVFTPMKQDIKEHFIMLLDTKAYDLDSVLWQRAKRSEVIKRFFRDAGIEGGYSSKTFLHYFLRGLDKSKLSPRSKELFNLLRYLEEVSKRNILIIRESSADLHRDKQIIEKVDSCLSIATEQKMIPAFNELCANKYDIVVMDWRNENVSALDFIRKFKITKKDAKIEFIILMPESKDSDFVLKARDLGVQFFVPAHDGGLLAESVRMAI